MIDFKHAWAQGQGGAPLAARMVAISGALLGQLYIANSLVGGPETTEEMVLYPTGFDCVTFIETTLALALASDYADYPEILQSLRYRDGQVDWAARQHYLSLGLDAAIHQGWLEWPVLTHQKTFEKELNLIAALPAQHTKMQLLDHTKPEALQQLQGGDVVAFASLGEGLDVFHCGLIVRVGDGVRLRHYSKKAGTSVEEPLADFLSRDMMAGILVARPK